MPNEEPRYNIAAIRELLLEAFTAEELRRLFLYTANPALRPLTQEFSPRDGLAAMVDRTITFCQTRALLPDLLHEVERERPRQYARFADRLSAPASTPSPPPSAASGGATYHIHINEGQGIAIGDGAQVINGGEG